MPDRPHPILFQLLRGVLNLNLNLLLILTATGIGSLRAAPVISEFMTANASTLADEDGDYSDWIEIANPDPQPVDLAGWFLTDSATDLTRWPIPKVRIPGGGFLVIFASGKNRTNDPTRLHTSFRLNADGGYLALVQPDRTTRVTVFENYPPQRSDVSFGDAVRTAVVPLLADGVPRVLAPTAESGLPTGWTRPEFLPGPEWILGAAPTAVGFDLNEPGSGTTSGSLTNLARTGSPLPTATQSTTLSGFAASLGINGNPGDFTHTLGTDSQATWTLNLRRRAVITSVTLHNRDSCCGSRLRDVTVDVLAEDGQTSVFQSALLNPQNQGFVFPSGPDHLDVILPSPVVGQYVRVRRQSDPNLTGTGGQGNFDEASVLSLGEVIVLGQEIQGYRPFLRTDLQAALSGRNASALLRIPFVLGDAAARDQLQLKVRYDDGFILFLNGTEVARRQAPGIESWNSAATVKRQVADAVVPESINLSAWIPQLVTGSNVLAAHLLNASASDPNLLFVPELSVAETIRSRNAFLRTPTPGRANQTDFYEGEVAPIAASVAPGFFQAPFSLSLTSTTEDAVLYYSINGDEPGPDRGLRYTGPIAVSNTTVLRARAFKPRWRPSEINTSTYLFLADVIRQASDWKTTRTPPPGFPATWGINSVRYGMDPAVVARYSAAEWEEALKKLPSISIVTEMGNLFDPATGIYANASGHGEEWERPGSIEFLDPTNAVPGRFSEPCGLRIRGGFSRNSGNPKHSLRVFFRSDYGPSKLRFPVFGPGGADEFDTFDLRTSQNYSWAGGDAHETLVREEFCEETLGALGQPYRRNRPAHLYLNGQYWGIYEFDERPEASYATTYFGGSKTNYDVVKCGNHVLGFVTEATDGNLNAWSNLWSMTQVMITNPSNSNYFRILGRHADGSRNPALPVLLDVDNLIDYMLEIFYSGDGDATLSSFLNNDRPNNWFGLRDRNNPDQGFRFFNSDCEHTLGAPNSQVDRTGPFGGSNEKNFTYSNPQWMHEELLRNAEYRLRFADHVQKHFFNGGALTVNAATNRFLARVSMIDRAIRAYSARWGSVGLGETVWRSEINSILKSWFPNRANVVLQQLRLDRLFPSVAAPRFSAEPGPVPAGFVLSLSQTNSGGSLFYTVDGSDPRGVDGVLTPHSLPYTGNFLISSRTRIRARARVGTDWSPMTEGLFIPPQDLSVLKLTEILYHPLDSGGVDGDQFEFLEFKNLGTDTLNLGGITIGGGVSLTLTNDTTVPAGGFLVVARDAASFQSRYPGISLAGVYGGKLNNVGDLITVTDESGKLILSVPYGTRVPWPTAPASGGYSLVSLRRDPTGLNPSLPGNWRTSQGVGGSPGADDPASLGNDDSDQDGLPDAWERLYGLNPDNASDAGVDSDLDGFTNLQEYQAGTLPNDAHSFLAFTAITVGSATELSFLARANRTYTLQYRDDLEFTTSPWQKLMDIEARTVDTLEKPLDPVLTGHRFYRLVTPAVR